MVLGLQTSFRHMANPLHLRASCLRSARETPVSSTVKSTMVLDQNISAMFIKDMKGPSGQVSRSQFSLKEADFMFYTLSSVWCFIKHDLMIIKGFLNI